MNVEVTCAGKKEGACVSEGVSKRDDEERKRGEERRKGKWAVSWHLPGLSSRCKWPGNVNVVVS